MTLFHIHARLFTGQRSIALLALTCVALFAIAGLSSAQARADDQRTRLVIHNDGGETLKCVILFGHWVTLDIAEVAPAKAVTVEIMRQTKDGGLYVPRFDGRHMMVERIACGRASQMWESSGDIPLLGLRATLVSVSESHCTLSAHVVCTTPEKSAEIQGRLWPPMPDIDRNSRLRTESILAAFADRRVA